MLQKLLTTKKILFAAILLMAGINTWGQIFTENMGTVSSNTAVASHTFQNSGTLTYSVNATPTTKPDVRNSTNSSGYPGSSAGANVFITNTGSIWFEISGINTLNYTSLSLSFGQHKSTTAGNNELIVEVSSDGSNYTALSYTRPTGSGTATWRQITPTGTIPSAANLRIRFRQPASASTQWRIDDVVLTGTAVPTTPVVTTDAVGTVTATTAVLNGRADANNAATVSVYFDYGTTTGYGSQVTATTPSSVSGTTETSFTGTASSLTPNTTYHYRAAGNNGTVYNGSDATFLTLANVPGAPVVGNPTTSSLDVSLNSATQNSNPAATQFAIQILPGGQYVQANGSLGGTAVWQTATTWSTVTVTGLDDATEYTFQVKARNSANVETAFGATAAGTTLTNADPLLEATTLSGFGDVCINTTSTQHSFDLLGENLDTTDVTVGPLAGYTFSLTEGGTYTPTLDITPVDGAVLEEIFVRFSPTAVQSYNGDIPVTGGGAASINVAATGSGVNTLATVTTATPTAVLGTTATLGGDVTAAGCTAVTTRGVVYATTALPELGAMGVTDAPDEEGGTGPFTVDVTGLTGSTTYYVRAYAISASGTSYGLQEQFTTLCTVPTDVTGIVSTPGTNQVALSWTNGSCFDEMLVVARSAAPVTATPTGNGSAYTANAAFGSGTEIVTGEFVVYKGTDTSVTVTNLTNTTTYYFTVFTRRGTTWSTGTTDSETPVITYCAASSTTIDGDILEYISNVSMNGTSNPSEESTYSDFTSTSFAVEQYGTYTLNVTLTNGFSGDRLQVYADWNHDGDFADSGEVIALTSSTGAGPYSNSITIPGSALTGTTRMRIRVYDANEDTGTVTSCGATEYGEVEDYTLNISAGVPTLSAPVATAASLISPSTFTANWEEVEGATGYLLDVYTQTVTTLAAWTFPNNPDNALVDEAVGANAGKSLSTVGAGAASYSQSGAATNAANASGWNNGSNSKYWQVEISTLGYSGISVSSAQNSSNTGPRDFKLQYRVGLLGAWTDVADASITVGNNWTSGILSVELPAACNNQASVYLRWIMTSNTAVSSSNDVASGGNSRIDNIYIRYNEITYIPGYENFETTATSEEITGLAPMTTYNYRVSAVGEEGVSNDSGHSNAIAAVTGTVNIWDNAAWSLGTPPTNIDNAIIQDNYSTDGNGTLSVANLIITDGTFTASAFDVTVVSKAISISGSGAMLVEDNAIVLQRDDNAENTGSIEIDRSGPALFRLDYKMWSSPVAGQVLGTFSPLTESNRFYTYNTNTDQYNGIANTNSFGTGAGYLIRMPNGLSVSGYNAGTTAHAWQGTFAGVPHTGEIEVPVTYNAVQTTENPGEGYNAIGNPYMSPISAGDFYQANEDKIDGTFYFWRKKNGSAEAAYVAYTPGLGGTGGGDDAIETGQGFIVNVTSNVGTLTFNNSMRAVNFNANNYRMPVAANTNLPEETEKHRYWLKLSNTAGVKSQALVGYVGNATNGVDKGIDGKLLADNAAVLYTIADATSLMVQGRPLPFNNTDVVPVGYKALTAGSYTITLENFDGLFGAGQNIYLKDKASNTIHNLSLNPYTFVSAAGTFDSRFEIVYTTDGALGTDNPIVSAESIVVFKDGNALNIAGGTTEIAAVAIYDIRGRLLYENTDVNATETSVTTLQAAQQVLVVQVTTSQNVKISKKVVF